MKQYVEPEISVSKFEAESIMTLSGLEQGEIPGVVVRPSNSGINIEKVELAF